MCEAFFLFQSEMKMKWNKAVLGCLLAAMVVVPGLLLYAPVPERQQWLGVCDACTDTWYELAVPGEDTLYFSALEGDSLAGGLCRQVGPVVRTGHANGFFVSYAGRFLTVAGSPDLPQEWKRPQLLPALRKESARLSRRMETYAVLLEETAYYARTHSVIDEGFHQVMEHAVRLQAEYDDMRYCLQVVNKVLSGSQAVAYRNSTRQVSYRTEGGNVRTAVCHRLTQADGLTVWQTADHSMPDSAVCVPLRPFFYLQCHLPRHRHLFWGWWGLHGRSPERMHGGPSAARIGVHGGRPLFPLADGADGAPVFGRWGCLNGLVAAGRIVGMPKLFGHVLSSYDSAESLWEEVCAYVGSVWKQIHALWNEDSGGWRKRMQKFSLPPAVAVYDYGSFQRSGTLFYGQLSGGRPQGEGVMCYPDGAVYSGNWQAGRREGYGEYTTSAGRKFSGKWRADTLRHGRCCYASAIYHGTFNHLLEADGEGDWRNADGSYYSGKWKGGRRDGFGFSVVPGEVVKCGVWSKDRFKGEQMIYHSERIYGIDISKYQHIHRRRVYGIDWKRLRITHLGHISRKKVRGEVDYPVSFVYVKCTEGLSVFNPYYTRDVRAARKHGYPVGAYHFFTTRPARRQAACFLRRAGLRRGDLPPMLDVELSDRKIEAMGGREALFREMLVWLRLVGQACGTTPVLYVSQDFVNRHLLFAPEELRAYPVWVARYGEYKPYVHLLYWQLSPDGTVEGIRGHVDIDVFNGTEEQFRHYLRTQTVK